MEKQKLIYVESKAQFSPSEVSDKAIVFIKDTKEIWTHGVYFSCSGTWVSPITLRLTGDTTGSVSIDGSGNASITTTTLRLSASSYPTDANNAASTAYHNVSYYRVNSDTSNLFPVTNNANSILSLNVHDYSYTHQLGFSSDGNIYHRRRNGGTWETSWREILTSTNYTKYPHTFASLTNKPTTLSGYGITDCIPIISGGKLTTETDLADIGMTTLGAKLSISHKEGADGPGWLTTYSNILMFRSLVDYYSALSIDTFNGYVTFIGGRNLETANNNVPNWRFSIIGANGHTYNLANIQTAINNLGSTYLPLTGGTLTDTLILKAGAFTASNGNSYSGGRYQAVAKPNMRLIGDSTYGLSTIEFVSQKGDTSINKPSDSAFIQFQPYGVSALSSVGSHPTLKTSGETNALVLGVTNDSDDIIVLQSPNISGLRHACGATEYYLPHITTSTTTANKPLVSTNVAHVYTLGAEYIPLSGGTMTGALNFANNTWNLVGDDAYMGDCNVAGMIGIKGSNAATPGFAMYNNSGTLLGKLYASGSDLYWSGVKLLTSTGSAQEAYLAWGGQNLASNSSPIDTILEPSLGANRLAFLSPDAIDIEYSQDGGTTWLNYNATDAQKVSLFCGGGNYSNFYLGGNSSTDPSIDRTPWRLRITISVIGYSLYCQFIKFLIYTTDVGNTTYCLLQGRKYNDYQNNVDTWVTFQTARIAGWSGWNTINHPNGIKLPNTADYAQLRFEFYMTSQGTTGRASIISRIEGFAHKCWSWPSNMAGYGNIYSYDWQQNVTFPAQVTATGGFSGNLIGDVTGNLIGNADTASNISTVNPILAQPFEKNTIQVVSNPQGALAEQQGTAAAITHALRFNWYNTAYEIGNVRGGASNSLGFGVTYGNNNLCLLVKTNGTYSPYGFIGDLTGNAASANKWAIARTITLTGDVTGSVSLDGSSNVTLTTSTSGTGTTSFLKCPDKRNQYPAEIVTSGGNIGASFMTASKLGISGDGTFYDALIIRGYRDSTGGKENAIMFSKNTSSVYHSQYDFGSTTTWGTLYKFLDSGNYKNYAPSLSGEGASGTWGISISGAANKVANALTLQLNGGTTSGTNKFVYDGSSAYTVNITPAAIGASATSHNHNGAYLKLIGGTLENSSANYTLLNVKSSTTILKIMAYSSDSTNYIQSGNSAFSGNAPLKLTGYNSNTGSNLYFNFTNIYCRGSNYTNIDSGNYNSYALPLSGGTLTGTLISRDVRPSANVSYSLGTSSYYYNYVYAKYFKKNGSSDSYVLLGGGGHKAVSDFAPNNVATLSSSGMGNSDQWTLVFEQSYPASHWYEPIAMFYVKGGTVGCGILCFYNYWNSATKLNAYEKEVWFFGAGKSETSATFGGANRDINDYLRIYIDTANFKYYIYYNRYNDRDVKIQELQFFESPDPLHSSFFTNSTTVVNLPTESSTLVRVPIKTTYNHDRTIKTSKSIYASSFYENSDIRLKENVQRIDQSDLTKQVDLVQFNFKDSDTKKYGVIAQQLEQVGLQNLVYENDGKKAVDYISLLVLEIQRLRNEIGELKQEINKKN